MFLTKRNRKKVVVIIKINYFKVSTFDFEREISIHFSIKFGSIFFLCIYCKDLGHFLNRKLDKIL